jgi:hypothetical protein
MLNASRRWKRPGRALAGLLAAVAIVAIGAGGLGWAQSGKGANGESKAQAKKDARQAAQPPAQAKDKTPAANAPQPVTRTVGGVQVAIDPATGRMRPPTPEEAQQLAVALDTMLSQDAENLPITQMPDGSLMANLLDSFQDVAMATKDKHGKVALVCVNQKEHARALLAGTAPVADARGAAAKKADRKPGNSGLEKE